MSAEDNYMDESFRKMSENVQATYHKDFWNKALNQLENDSLDDAFRAAAQVPIMPDFEAGGEGLADVFMEEAFRDAADNVAVVYDPAFWSELEAAEPDLAMDEAFNEAANQVVVNYSPLFWGDANSALEKEGLHYEYQHAYWDEARDLLDKADRKLFFTKWTSVAIVLLLVSFFGLNSTYNFNLSKVDRIELKAQHLQNKFLTNHSNSRTVSPSNANSADQESWNAGNETADTQPSTHSDLADKRSESLQYTQGIDGPSNLNDNTDGRSEYGINAAVEVAQGNVRQNAQSTHETEEVVDRLNQNQYSQILNHEMQALAPINRSDAEMLVMNEVTLLPVAKEDYQSERIPHIELNPLELKPFHQISLVGLIGLGKNYGANTYLLTKRYGARLEYVYAGSKGFRAAKPGHFEWGAHLGFNYVECDGLGIENQVKQYKTNGEVEKYWRNLQIFDLFYANISVFANYSLNNHHKFRVGVGVDHLFAVQSNMAYRMDDDKGIQTVNNNWGVQDGLSINDFKASFGYEYMFNTNWAFQLNFTSGILNRTKNEFFNLPNGRNLEQNLTIGIRRTLFTKL